MIAAAVPRTVAAFAAVAASALLILSAPLASSAAPTSSPRILGGRPAPLYISRSLVKIDVVSRAGTLYLCSGTLVSPRHVLSAAHCFAAVNPRHRVDVRRTRVHVASRSLRTPYGDGEQVAAVFVHRGFKPGKARRRFNDIALLTLARDVPLSKHVAPVGVVPLGDMRGKALVAGYGVSSNKGDFPNEVQAAHVTTLPFKTCLQADRASARAVRRMYNLCAGSDGFPNVGRTDSCAGDSGGPILIQRNGVLAQVGITSFGPSPCAAKGSVAWYERVDPYMPALHDLMKKDGTRSFRKMRVPT